MSKDMLTLFAAIYWIACVGEQGEQIFAAKSHGRARVVKCRALPAPRRRWAASAGIASNLAAKGKGRAILKTKLKIGKNCWTVPGPRPSAARQWRRGGIRPRPPGGPYPHPLPTGRIEQNA